MIGAKSVLAQSQRCCSIDDCPEPPTGSTAECILDSMTLPPGEDCDETDINLSGYCGEVEDHVHNHDGHGSGSSAQGISECYKLRTNVKLKMPGGVDDTTFVKGVVIAPRPLSGLECKHARVSGVTVGCGASSRMNSDCYTTEFGIIVVLDYLSFITGWLFYILMLIVTIFIIYGGFLVITAAGDPEKSGKGKQVVTYAIIGLAVALLARVIPALVSFIIGV